MSAKLASSRVNFRRWLMDLSPLVSLNKILIKLNRNLRNRVATQLRRSHSRKLKNQKSNGKRNPKFGKRQSGAVQVNFYGNQDDSDSSQDKVIQGLEYQMALCYIDDVIVYGPTLDICMDRMQVVLERVRNAKLKLKAKKCILFARETKFLGHVISKDGVRTDPDKVRAILDWASS